MTESSVIIVTYNTADTIGACLASLEAQADKNFEVVVVDNASTDGTLAKLKFKDKPRLQVVCAPKNLGFTGGNLLGYQRSRGKVVIFLNPDTVVPKDYVARLTASALDPARGVVGCNIQYPSGELQMGGSTFPTFRSLLYDSSSYKRFFPHSRSFKRFIMSDWDRRSSRFIDAVPGAAFAIRREVLDAIGGLDPHYFLFYEEYDLSRALKRLKLRAYFDASILITHVTHSATDKVPAAEIGAILASSRDYYIQKTHGRLYFKLFKLTCRGFDLGWSICRRVGLGYNS